VVELHFDIKARVCGSHREESLQALDLACSEGIQQACGALSCASDLAPTSS
jgi:hypothetical protein